jgi:hypothetical protein
MLVEDEQASAPDANGADDDDQRGRRGGGVGGAGKSRHDDFGTSFTGFYYCFTLKFLEFNQRRGCTLCCYILSMYKTTYLRD